VASREPRRFTDGISIGVLTRIFHRDLVDDALLATGKSGQRNRLLPGRVVVYFVLALCLFYGEPYEEVMRKLVNGLRFLGNWTDSWRVPTSSAMTQARQRVGPTPFKAMFDEVALPLARPGTIGGWFHGMRVLAIDGVIIDLPDTPENIKDFGTKGQGQINGPFPRVRLLGLGECGTHAIVGATFDSCATSERTLLTRLLADVDADRLDGDTLLLCDRGFYSYQLWRDARASGAELLWRIKDDLILPVLENLPDGSFRSELLPRSMKNDTRRGKRRNIPDDARIPVRVMEYTVTNRGEKPERIRLLTSILDYTLASAQELAELYHERWEFELTLDEVETHQMTSTKNLRSRTPELVRQEIWALLLTHYAVRAFMQEAADDVGEDSDRLSFTRTIRVLRRQVGNQAGFSPSPPPASDTRDDRGDTRAP
jgi:hypothetical protein